MSNILRMNPRPTLNEKIIENFSGPTVWTKSTYPKDKLHVQIPEDVLDELATVADTLENLPWYPSDLRVDHYNLDKLKTFISSTVNPKIMNGEGVLILDRIPVENYSNKISIALYWLISSLISRPVAQKFLGTMVYDVKDTGRVHNKKVRGSVTKIRLPIHTDNAYGIAPPSILCLLCLKDAKNGGESSLLSFTTLYNILYSEHRELLSRAFLPFFYNRQSEHAPDDPEVIERPIFSTNGNKLFVRYASGLIRAGYEIADREIDDEGSALLDLMDSLTERDDLRIEMKIEPGQIQLLDNSIMGHARRAFEDDKSTGHVRHMVRLWLRNWGSPSYNGDWMNT